MTKRSSIRILLAAAIAAALPLPAATAGAWAAPVRGTLLPVPPAGPNTVLSVSASDVSPAGVVVGTANRQTTQPDGTQSSSTRPLRWLPVTVGGSVGSAGWRRQQLSVPPGIPFAAVTGVTDRGEAAGTIGTGSSSHAVRWPLAGGPAISLGGDTSTLSAVGPDGPWGVDTPNSLNPIGGDTELVSRTGERTPLSGTPELDAGYRRTVISIGGPQTAVVGVTSGVGFGGRFSPVLWRDGATLALPVFNSPLGVHFCMSAVQPDGSLVYAGLDLSSGTPQQVLVRHVGGIPGTNTDLDRAGAAPYANLFCTSGSAAADVLAADGGVGGSITDANGVSQAAYWDAANTRTLIPLADGETSSIAVAVATGGRLVLQSQTADGTRLTFWHDGVRTPLATPAGWSVSRVVELTDRGRLLANLSDAQGHVRPAVWNLAQR
jgi:hypothetical protein